MNIAKGKTPHAAQRKWLAGLSLAAAVRVFSYDDGYDHTEHTEHTRSV